MKRFEVVPLIMMVLLLMFNLGCEPNDPGVGDPGVPPNVFNPNLTYWEMIDERDGQTYKTIEIGTQTWMAQNLNYNTENSWCYNNDTNKCITYGRLYNWQAALTACPPGWHLPTDTEWTILTDYLGRGRVAGGKMKSTSSLWRLPNTGATNESGFSGLPGGGRDYYGNFNKLGSHGYWWSASEYSADGAWLRGLYYSGGVFGNYYDKDFGSSVRCLRD